MKHLPQVLNELAVGPVKIDGDGAHPLDEILGHRVTRPIGGELQRL